MEYSELNNYLVNLKLKDSDKSETSQNNNSKDISKKGVATINILDRDLNLFNDLNNYNNVTQNKLDFEYQSKQDYKNNDLNSRLGERGFTPNNSVFNGQMGPLQNVVLDMTPLSTRVISKEKNNN
jgi:hypothetical protein